MGYSYPAATDLGAVADGSYDNSDVLDEIWHKVKTNNLGKLIIPPGEYHGSRPWIIRTYIKDDAAFSPQAAIEGWGAVFDFPVVFIDQSLSVTGLSVVDVSDDHGFIYIRGQGSQFNMLRAENCAGHGHYFGCQSLDKTTFYAPNSQVTGISADGLYSVKNKCDGLHFGSDADVNRNWSNQNLLTNYVGIQNQGAGIGVTKGSGPKGGSRLNYTTFINTRLELNQEISDLTDLSCRGVTFLGGLISDKDGEGNSLSLPPINYVIGGRYAGDILGKEKNTVIANTGARYEGGSFSYIPGRDD